MCAVTEAPEFFGEQAEVISEAIVNGNARETIQTLLAESEEFAQNVFSIAPPSFGLTESITRANSLPQRGAQVVSLRQPNQLPSSPAGLFNDPASLLAAPGTMTSLFQSSGQQFSEANAKELRQLLNRHIGR